MVKFRKWDGNVSTKGILYWRQEWWRQLKNKNPNMRKGEKVKSGLGEQIGSWWNSSSPRLRGGKWKSTGNIRKWKLEGERWILKEFIGSPLSGWQMKICCDVWNGAKMRPTSAKLPSVSLDGSGTGGVLSAKIISSYLCVWEWDYMVIICLLLLFRFFLGF